MTNKKNNAFTIVELVVAMGLLVMLVGLSSMVFSSSVKAHRKAAATIEITRNLRVITEQLTADFRGLRKDAPMMFRFEPVGTDTDGSGTIDADEYVYYDMTHFFADGDFQAMDPVVSGNLSRIYYGHANSQDLFTDNTLTPDFDTYHVLSRKAHILTADSGIFSVYGQIPLISNAGVLDYSQFAATFGQTNNYLPNYLDENILEFNTITLNQWIDALNYLNAGSPANANAFITYCMSDTARPYINLEDYQTLHLLMSQGVTDFEVQWAYTVEDLTTSATTDTSILSTNPGYFAGVRWWPDVDPLGDGIGSGMDADNDFVIMGNVPFGVYFEMPGQTSYPDWDRVKPNSTESPAQMANRRCRAQAGYFRQDFYPKALKFTLRLKDSNDLFPDGKTFTHIVYLDN